MIQFLAAVSKELLLLRRDRSGLLLLFAMPALLVLVITLVQNNAARTLGLSQTDILFIDNGGQTIGARLASALSGAEGVNLVKTIGNRHPDKEAALKAVAKGDFQLCLIIPEGLTAAVRRNARYDAMQALSMTSGMDADASRGVAELEIYFDPSLLSGLRSTVKNLLQLMVVGIETEEKVNALAELLPVKLEHELAKSLGPMTPELASQLKASIDLKWNPDPVLRLREQAALGKAFTTAPNAVQQNVPAWSLFGVFFIVLPLAGSFVKERLYGVQYRILSLPVSYLTIAAGKVFAYMLVGLVQFGLIFCIGKWILPILGASAFDVGGAPLVAAAVAISAILAATGYGVLLGTVARSYEQASMFGPISIVIASALGGIMVPVWAMPEFMQKVSSLSPLAWAQNAFLDVFVRDGNLLSVSGNIACLMLFALACIVSAWLVFNKRVAY